MRKNSVNFKCKNCGSLSSKWSGQCHTCLEWNSFEEVRSSGKEQHLQKAEFFTLLESSSENDRLKIGLMEFNMVLGGGLVPGASILIGGEPGIGKSTILLQIAQEVAILGKDIHYYSGEESKSQILLRANRLKVSHEKIQVSTLSNLEEIISNVVKSKPELVILDSIQTCFSNKIDSIIGSINQIKYTCQELVATCKTLNTSLILVGHITKDGQIAGPKTIEHMVDTVLYFESDKGNDLRLIRTAKNRYGSTSEIGIFKMTETGLAEIPNSSSLFLSAESDKLNGTCIFPATEGSRVIFLEIQVLVAPSSYSTAKRTVVGWDGSRLSMLLAVLESRCNLIFSNVDIYLSIAGGIKTADPAADLAVAASLISSKLNLLLDRKTVIFGEINLSGTIRESHKTEARIKESEKLGFKKAILSKNAKIIVTPHLEIEKMNNLNEFILYLKKLAKSTG